MKNDYGRGLSNPVCRLLAYATPSGNHSLKEVLTQEQIEGYLWMSTIHNDGWGAAHMVDASHGAGVPDGGAVPGDTTTSVYRSTESAFLDPLVEAVTAEPARSATFHLRLATPGIPLAVENQQPFTCDGITFMHNGSIENEEGNVLDSDNSPVTHEEFERTGGRSDSAVFFASVIKNYETCGNMVEAVSTAISGFREDYPDCSYNCVLQTEDALVFVHAVGTGPVSEELGKIYTDNGFAKHIADYRDVKYRKLSDGGVVVASTGFEQPEEEGWHELANNSLIAVDTHSGEFEVVKLA